MDYFLWATYKIDGTNVYWCGDTLQWQRDEAKAVNVSLVELIRLVAHWADYAEFNGLSFLRINMGELSRTGGKVTQWQLLN